MCSYPNPTQLLLKHIPVLFRPLDTVLPHDFAITAIPCPYLQALCQLFVETGVIVAHSQALGETLS